MSYRYADPTQSFDAWAEYRRRLRAQLDTLAGWASELIIATFVILSQVNAPDIKISSWISGDECRLPLPGQGSRSQQAC